jgi:hypothetical protein
MSCAMERGAAGPSEFAAFIKEDLDRSARVVAEGKIKVK